MVSGISNFGSNYRYNTLNITPSQDNVFNKYHAKYGCGYEDFGTGPSVQNYTMSYLPRCPEAEVKTSFLDKIKKLLFI